MRWQILKQLDGILSELQAALRQGIPFSEVYSEAIHKEDYVLLQLSSAGSFRVLSAPDVLSQEEKQLWMQCFAALGTKTTQQQEKIFEEQRKQMNCRMDALRQKHRKAQQLYTKIGLYLGIILAVVLL